jgi:hypothetical protein
VVEDKIDKKKVENSIELEGTQANPIKINNDPQPSQTREEEVDKEEVLLEVAVEESPHSPIA